jgi:hypothetical protein
MPDDERIRGRAHEIWESEGRPEGRHEEHWTRARREIEAVDGGSVTGPTGSDTNSAGIVPGAAKPERAKGETPPPDPGASEAARIID